MEITEAQVRVLRQIKAIADREPGRWDGPTIRSNVLAALVRAGYATVSTERVGGTTRRAKIRTVICGMYITDAGREYLNSIG